MTQRAWTRTSPTSWRCEPWTIGKVTVAGRDLFELWHDDERRCLARKDTLNEACEAARRAEQSRAHLGEND